MNGLFEAMKGHAASATARVAQNRTGIVTSYDPGTGMARVEFQPEGILSGWLQVASQSVGAGWGMHTPLAIGTQVLIAPLEGDSDSGVIVGALFSSKAQPPSAADGEFVLRSNGGAVLHLRADGSVAITGGTIALTGNVVIVGNVSIHDGAGAGLAMSNNGTVAVSGVLAVTGEIKVNGVHVNVP